MKPQMRWKNDCIRTALGVILFGCVALFAANPRAVAQEKSLDEQLFDELDDQLFSDLKPLQEEKATDSDQNAAQSNLLDCDLQRALGGEDPGQRRGSSPLKSIADSMQEAQRRIQANDMATQTQQIQGRIVSDLEDLIEQLRKQNQQQQSSSKGQQPKKSQQQKQQPKRSKQQSQGKPPGNKPSNQPSKQSTTRLGNAEATDASVATQDRIMQDAWGNLPSSVQEEMRSARPEKFLPKYSRLIEDYFRRLAAERKK